MLLKKIKDYLCIGLAGVIGIVAIACSTSKNASDASRNNQEISSKPVYSIGVDTIIIKELEEAVNVSDIIVRGKVVDNKESSMITQDLSDTNGITRRTFPMIDSTIKVSKVFKGNIKSGDEIIIRHMDGEFSDVIYVIKDAPSLDKDKEFYLFAVKNSDGTYKELSGQQGRLAIENNSVLFPIKNNFSNNKNKDSISNFESRLQKTIGKK